MLSSTQFKKIRCENILAIKKFPKKTLQNFKKNLQSVGKEQNYSFSTNTLSPWQIFLDTMTRLPEIGCVDVAGLRADAKG
jgi:hypothetical protein